MNSFRFFHLSGQDSLNLHEDFVLEDWEGKTIHLRPYQREAAEKILLNASRISSRFGIPAVVPGGIVQFAPGTGKTLTSFCTAQFVSQLSNVKKVFFVVDQNDLDWRSVRNFAAQGNGFIDLNSGIESLLSTIYHTQSVFIPTTFQKLESFLRTLRDFESFKKHTIFIYDECQSVLTADRQALISRVFPNSQHYFFTSSSASDISSAFFGQEIFSYPLSQAIKEQNLLPFQIEYELTQNFTFQEEIPEVDAINEFRALLSPERIQKIVKKILERFGQKSENQHFNSLLAVNDEISAMNYYVELRHQLSENKKNLQIAAIYDPNEGGEKNTRLRRDFWELVTEDYNAQFHTNFSSIGDRFTEYFLDVSRRMALGEIDLLLVVNHLLTSFDSANLNTLWVDRDFSSLALLQAFSRTNRIGPQKSVGNVISFRDLARQVKEILPPEAFEKP